MTARARRLLAALEDGCSTRDEIFAHQGRFSLLNNSAAELRAAGVDVVCTLEDDGEYHYRLIDSVPTAFRVDDEADQTGPGRDDTPPGDTRSSANPAGIPEQLSLEVAA